VPSTHTQGYIQLETSTGSLLFSYLPYTFLLSTYAPTLLSYLLIPPLVQGKPRCRAPPRDRPAFPEGRWAFRASQERPNQAQRYRTPNKQQRHSSPSRLPRRENSMSSKTSTAARPPPRKKLARLPKPSASVNCLSRRPGAVTMLVRNLRHRLRGVHGPLSLRVKSLRLRLRRPPPLRSVVVPEPNAHAVRSLLSVRLVWRSSWRCIRLF
jgi:hypothetical protein